MYIIYVYNWNSGCGSTYEMNERESTILSPLWIKHSSTHRSCDSFEMQAKKKLSEKKTFNSCDADLPPIVWLVDADAAINRQSDY